jgi:uncharacterized protein (TIGR03435 family)
MGLRNSVAPGKNSPFTRLAQSSLPAFEVAWSLQNQHILGARRWIFEGRFEIQATTGRPASSDEERLMMKRLLAGA